MFPESLVKGYEEKYESSLPVGSYAGCWPEGLIANAQSGFRM